MDYYVSALYILRILVLYHFKFTNPNSNGKARTPLIRFVVDLLYNVLYDFSACCGLVVDMLYNIWTCCRFVADLLWIFDSPGLGY